MPYYLIERDNARVRFYMGDFASFADAVAYRWAEFSGFEDRYYRVGI